MLLPVSPGATNADSAVIVEEWEPGPLPERELTPTPEPDVAFTHLVWLEGTLGWDGAALGPYLERSGSSAVSTPSTATLLAHDDWYLATGDPTHACTVVANVEMTGSLGTLHPDLHAAVPVMFRATDSTCDDDTTTRVLASIEGFGISDLVGTEAADVGVDVPVTPLHAQAAWVFVNGAWLPVGYLIRLRTDLEGILELDATGHPVVQTTAMGQTGAGVLRVASLTRWPL